MAANINEARRIGPLSCVNMGWIWGTEGAADGDRYRSFDNVVLDIRNRSGPHGRRFGAATPPQHLSGGNALGYRREWASLVALPPAFSLCPLSV